MKITLWLVGTGSQIDSHPHAWQFVGIFFTKKRAIKACNKYYDFVAPIKLNFKAPENPTIFPDIFFPIEEEEK